MKGVKNSLRVAIEIALPGALVFGLLVALSACKGGKPVTPASTSTVDIFDHTPTASSTPGALITERPDSPSTSYPPPQGAPPGRPTSPIEVYPPPIDEGGLVIEVPEPSPTPTATPVPFPETPPAPAGKAATLHNGDVWLVEPGHQPQALTDFGDVSAIFGWSRDGTKLLFGRGRYEHAEYTPDTTDLWLIDVDTRQARQLTTSNMVASAAWSPVDERIAYCDYDSVLTVIDLDGESLYRLERVLLRFTWSPDGSAIALQTYTPDMIDVDGLKFTALGVWWFEANELQVFLDEKDESQSWPVWSMDGKYLLFLRDSPKFDKRGLGGMYIADVVSGQVLRLEDTSSSAEEMSRSPRANLVAYRLGSDIYMMDFDGRFEIVGRGRALTWLPDGSTLLFRAEDGILQNIVIDIAAGESAVGGQRPTNGLYIQPEYFFAPGG